MMPTRTQILATLPPYMGTERMIVRDQRTEDIIDGLVNSHNRNKDYYDNFSKGFWCGSAGSTSRNIFDFLKKNVSYREEPERKQTVKPPHVIISEGKSFGGDCKHYASFICGVVDSLKRQGYKIDCCYRFVGYKNDRPLGHVFAVVIDGKREYWVDPVLQSFNQRFPVYAKHKDIKTSPMAKVGGLYEINGISGCENNRPVRRHWLDDRIGSPFGTYPSGQPLQAIGNARLLVYPSGQPLQAVGGAKIGFSIKLPKIDVAGAIKKITQTPGKAFDQVKHAVDVNATNLAKGIKIDVNHAITDIKDAGTFVVNTIKKVTLAVPRNAFLVLVKLNAFSLATDIYTKTKTAANWNKLAHGWAQLGGDVTILKRAVTQGLEKYNHDHPSHKIGEPLTVAASLAAAAPIIADLSKILKSLGIDTDKIGKAIKPATADLAAAHSIAKSNGGADANGVVTHNTDGATVKTQAEDNSDGSQTLSVDVTPTDSSINDSPGAAAGKLPAQAKKPAPGLDNYLHTAEDWVKGHQKELITGVGAAVGISLLVSGMNAPKKTKNSKLIGGGVVTAASLLYYKMAK